MLHIRISQDIDRQLSGHSHSVRAHDILVSRKEMALESVKNK